MVCEASRVADPSKLLGEKILEAMSYPHTVTLPEQLHGRIKMLMCQENKPALILELVKAVIFSVHLSYGDRDLL